MCGKVEVCGRGKVSGERGGGDVGGVEVNVGRWRCVGEVR